MWGSFLGLAAALGGCAFAPGMRYGESGPSNERSDTSATFNGVLVELRTLTPQEALLVGKREDSLRRVAVPPELLQFNPGPYRIGKHDILTIAVWEHPELTMPFGAYRNDEAAGQNVDDSGTFFFPYAGKIKAEGLTTGELREVLMNSLDRALATPQIDAKVTSYRSQRVYVGGSVARPGMVAINDLPLNLLDALAKAGGILPNSDPRRLELMRDGKTHVLDLNALTASRQNAFRILLKHGDVVRVPEADENKVYVLGEVERPSALAMASGKMTLVNALVSSGGLSPLSAQSKSIYVIRGEVPARIKVWHLNARNPLALAMADQFALRPKDLVYVDATGLANWNRMLNLILPTVNLLNLTTGTAVNVNSVLPE